MIGLGLFIVAFAIGDSVASGLAGVPSSHGRIEAGTVVGMLVAGIGGWAVVLELDPLLALGAAPQADSVTEYFLLGSLTSWAVALFVTVIF